MEAQARSPAGSSWHRNLIGDPWRPWTGGRCLHFGKLFSCWLRYPSGGAGFGSCRSYSVLIDASFAGLLLRQFEPGKDDGVSRSDFSSFLWEIRRHSIEFQNTTANLSGEIFHVSRSINVGAHFCAKQAKSSASARPIRSCGNSAHSTYACPVLVAIDRLHLQEYVIHSVKCL
jgi:hypothetical protein